mmetsp:Transcript_23287/g.68753  ORF Transcript_23287/g.68753 Transcript_23287/m.68753 type:complete len:307 (+) Transcript_23287:703-1623(+)
MVLALEEDQAGLAGHPSRRVDPHAGGEVQAERLGVAAPLPAAPVHEAQPSRLAVLVVPGQRLVERRDVQEVAGPHDILAAGEGRAVRRPVKVAVPKDAGREELAHDPAEHRAALRLEERGAHADGGGGVRDEREVVPDRGKVELVWRARKRLAAARHAPDAGDRRFVVAQPEGDREEVLQQQQLLLGQVCGRLAAVAAAVVVELRRCGRRGGGQRGTSRAEAVRGGVAQWVTNDPAEASRDAENHAGDCSHRREADGGVRRQAREEGRGKRAAEEKGSRGVEAVAGREGGCAASSAHEESRLPREV